MEGKVRAALRLIDDDKCGGPLHLNHQIIPTDSRAPPESVCEILLKKHPPKQQPKPSSIIMPDLPTEEPHPVIYDGINGQLIQRTTLRTDGSAGPSGLDAAAWKHLCISFRSVLSDLCDSLASTAKRICSTFADPRGICSGC